MYSPLAQTKSLLSYNLASWPCSKEITCKKDSQRSPQRRTGKLGEVELGEVETGKSERADREKYRYNPVPPVLDDRDYPVAVDRPLGSITLLKYSRFAGVTLG